ncbi:MAG: dihydroxyacetone kinase subunit DhaL [Actinomycetota bacterium]
MEKFTNSKSSGIVLNLIEEIRLSKEYLSRLDGAIGDGDHGINMNKGFTMAKTNINQDMDLSISLDVLGTVLISEIGGSMGPLYGVFFKALASACNSKEEIDKYIFLDMIEKGYEKIVEIGSAQVGDKTLIDTLDPAYNVFKNSVNDKNFKELLELMIEAADKGKDSTLGMVAKIGRSARLGERSRGFLDAGAVSCYIILKSMGESIISIIEDK